MSQDIPRWTFSEQYLQWSAKFQEGAFPNSSGSNGAANLRAISKFGIPKEEAWPYEISQWGEDEDAACAGDDMPTRCYTNGAPPQGAIDADKYFLPTGRYVSSRSIKSHITNKKTGVVVGLDFFYQAWNHRKSTLPTTGSNWNKGIVLAPNSEDVTESHKHRAGHSILIIGWDDTLEVPKRDKEGEIVVDEEGEPVVEKGFYLFKNSWGTSGFGIQNANGAGYGYISMQYLHSYGSARVADVPQGPGTGGGETNEKTFQGQVGKGEMLFHAVTLPSAAKNIKVVLSGTNDADLYTRFDSKPSQQAFDCRPYRQGSDETCNHPSLLGESLEIGVYGWASGASEYQVKVTWEE